MSISLNCKKKPRNFWKAAQEKKKDKTLSPQVRERFLKYEQQNTVYYFKKLDFIDFFERHYLDKRQALE